MEQKTALIVGATGLVGRQVLRLLLSQDYYQEIIILGRRSVDITDNRITEHIINFDELDQYKDKISANDYYICIGTTMAEACSEEAFYKVDFTYPYELGLIAKKDPKFEQYLLVSSLGADAESPLLYNEVKGKIENALKEMNFRTLHIFQPSLLTGARQKHRFFEELAKIVTAILSVFVIGNKKFWAINDSDVAKSMFMIARRQEKGTFTHRPYEMLKITHPPKDRRY